MVRRGLRIVRVMVAAAVATSVVVATNPASAASASVSKAEQAVVKAEKLGIALKKEISPEYRKAKYPKNPVGYPDMKLFNDTKQALSDARKAVATLNGKDKDVLLARLEANVALHVNRASAYIDAVNAGVMVQKAAQKLNVLFTKGIVDDQTVKLYNELNAEIKRATPVFDRVYGGTKGTQFKAFYTQSAVNMLNNLTFPISIKREIDKANAALKAGKVDEAAQSLGNVQYFLKEAAKKGQKETNKLIVGSLAKQKAVQADFSRKAVLYVAKSSPITIGPSAGAGGQIINKNVYVYAGTQELIELRNLTINGNVVVLGSPVGAGSVFFENVKVYSGKIVVENVADYSFHLKGVQASQVVVNDADGSTIVVEKGTKINNLVVSEKAGAKGKAILESEESGAISTVTIAAKGTSKSLGTELKGDFSKTNVIITGQNAKLALAKSTEVMKVEFKVPAQMTIPEGAKVMDVTKDPSVRGDVNVYNKGIIENADAGLRVNGNAPRQTNQPPSYPGETAINSFAVVTNLGNLQGEFDQATNTFSISLASLGDIDQFKGLEFNTSKAAKLVITSIKGEKRMFMTKKLPLEFPATSGLVNIATFEIWEGYSSGAGQYIHMNMLRTTGQYMTIQCKLIAVDKTESKEITIKISY